MPIASLVVGGVALLLTLTAFIGTFVPGVPSWLMAIVSLLAPVTALIGIVLGGVGLSRAKEENVGTGLATGALVLNAIVILPAFFVGIACGACNIMCASGGGAPRNRGGATPGYYDVDAGPYDPSAPRPGTVAPPLLDPGALPPFPTQAADPNAPSADPNAPSADPNAPSADPNAPPVADPNAPAEPVDPAQPPPMFE